MSNKMWESVVEHAKTCTLNGKLHVYYADEHQNIGVIFNNIFVLMGLIADGHYMSVDRLSDPEKVRAGKEAEEVVLSAGALNIGAPYAGAPYAGALNAGALNAGAVPL